MSNPRLLISAVLAHIPWLLLLAAAAAVALTLAYQVRPAYTIGMDSSFDRHFLPDGWHQPEEFQGTTYRWTTGYSLLHFEGVARQPFRLVVEMNTAAVDPRPVKRVQVNARGALVAVFTATNVPSTFEAPIPPELVSRATGDLDILITSDSFTPPGDPRGLGVSVNTIRLEPAGDGGPILPPAEHLLYVLGIALCAYLIAAVLSLGRRICLAVGLGALAAVVPFYALDRAPIAFYAPGLLWALFLSLIALMIAWPLVTGIYRRGGLTDFGPNRPEGRALFGLFAAGLIVAWGGLLYPQSEPNDFGFHLHRFQEVQGGNLFFENYVVSGIGLGFYPPAMYVLLLPFNAILRNDFYLVRLAPAFLSVSAVFIVYYLAKRYVTRYRSAALLSAALYTVMPIHLLVLWWAHETNLFGLVILLATLTYILVAYEHMGRPLVWLGLAALLFVLLLSHPGVLVWSLALLSALLVTFLLLRRVTGRGSYRSVLAIGAALLAAGLLAYALYYSHYVGIFGQAAYVPGRGGSALSETLSELGDLSDLPNMLRLTAYHGVLADYGLVPLLLAPIGLLLLFRRNPESSTPFSTPHSEERFRWALLVWVAVGLGFLLVSIVTALPIRPLLFVWPPVSMLSGAALAAFLEAERPALVRRKAIVALLIAGLACLSLFFWALANFLDMRIPHVYPHVF